MQSISIRQEGDRVLLLKNGVLIADMPYQTALELSRALHVKGKDAEAHAKAEQIIGDQALLIRSGAPFGLTRHPAMLHEAIKEAQSNRALRRYLPSGIRSLAIVGSPTIIQHPPKGDESDGK
jgi:hypothetical protein